MNSKKARYMPLDPHTPHPQLLDEHASLPSASQVRSAVRGSMPSIALPAQPFAAALPAFEPPPASATGASAHEPFPGYQAAISIERPNFAAAGGDGYSSAGSLTDFSLAVSDRRNAPRGGSERRSAPRPYASPWMARPSSGTIDPRPEPAPRGNEPRVIAPITTIMPEIPLAPHAAPAAGVSLPPAAPAAPEPVAVATPALQPPAALAAPAAPVAPVAPAAAPPAPAAPEAPASSPFAGLAPARISAVDVAPLPEPAVAEQTPTPADQPLALPQQLAIVEAIPAPAPAPAPASGDPLGNVFGMPSAVQVAAIDPNAWFPGHQVAEPVEPAGPQIAVTPPSIAVAIPAQQTVAAPIAPAEAPRTPEQPAPSNLLPGQLAREITSSIALQPQHPPQAASMEQARSGSMLVRATLLVGAPAIAGTGIGYLLSLLIG